jgi:polyisoprenoid-binding protein YceI
VSGLPAGDWEVDAAQSTLGFRTRAIFGLLPVRGRFGGFEGTLRVDAAGRASGALVIDAGTLTTGLKVRDGHLRGAGFFGADEHRHLIFTLAEVVPEPGAQVAVAGTLAVRDKTLPITAPVSVAHGPGERLRLQARFRIDHDAAGLGWQARGMVPATVDARVSLVLVPQR